MIFLKEGTWEVRKTKDRGKGFFVKINILPGTVIGDYLGVVLCNADLEIEDTATSFYLMYYHDRASIYPDLKREDVHLVNHSCEPSLGMYVYKGHTLFFALRQIFPNEELTISYMLSPKDELCEPCLHVCSCGSKACCGTMHLTASRYAAWTGFQLKQSTKSKRMRVAYNKPLKRLAVYPESITDDPIYDLYGNRNKVAYVCNEEKLPPAQNLRKLIRETGKTLEFPKLKLKVYGLVDNKPLIYS